MDTLTDEESAEWCRARGFEVDAKYHVRFRTKCGVFDVTGIEPNQRVVYAGHLLANACKSNGFGDGLVWLREWELGDYVVKRKIFERIRLSYGAEGWPIVKPGHRFDQNEETDAAMFVTLMLLFQSEGYFIAEDGSYMVNVQAAEQAVVVAATKAPEALIRALSEFYRVAELHRGDIWYPRMVNETGEA